MKRFAIAGLLLAVATGCATSPTGRSQLMLISPEAAIVESKKAYLSTVSQLEEENKLVDDPKVADRVATITGRLVTVAVEKFPNTANWEWSVAIINDPVINTLRSHADSSTHLWHQQPGQERHREQS